MTIVGKRLANVDRNARQRPITCPTGSSLQRPRLNGRSVIPATSPYRSAHSVSSRRGTAASPTGTSETSISASFNLSSERRQPRIDALVAALDLADVLNDRVSLSRERREQHRHARANIGTLHHLTPQWRWSRDHRAMGIAQHDARAHADQLVDEK